jgi:hypothetical protein
LPPMRSEFDLRFGFHSFVYLFEFGAHRTKREFGTKWLKTFEGF